MLLELLIDDMPYLTCNQDQHQEELSIVCLQSQCHKALLICPICEDQDHKDHHTIPLRAYLKQAGEDKGQAAAILDNIELIESMKRTVKQHMKSYRDTFLKEMEVCERRAVQYFDRVSERLMEISLISSSRHIEKVVSNLSEEEQSLSKFNKLVQNIRVYGQTPIQEVLSHYVTAAEGRVHTFKSIFKEISIMKYLDQINGVFGPLKEFSLNSGYSWSHLKAKYIQIDGLVASQVSSGNSTSGERFALMECKGKGSSAIVVGFKIRKLKGWIGVGICLQNVIVKTGYLFNYTKPFHGSYLVSSNGYSWSHSHPQLNSVSSGFPFMEGDTIKVTYHPGKLEVLFELVNKPGSFRLQVLEPLSDKYVPCVNMCNQGAQVEIANDLGQI